MLVRSVWLKFTAFQAVMATLLFTFFSITNVHHFLQGVIEAVYEFHHHYSG